MKDNKVQEILNQNIFDSKVVYPVSGRAINDLIDAWEDMQELIRVNYELKIEQLQSEIENLECEIDYLEHENGRLNDELDSLEK